MERDVVTGWDVSYVRVSYLAVMQTRAVCSQVLGRKDYCVSKFDFT